MTHEVCCVSTGECLFHGTRNECQSFINNWGPGWRDLEIRKI